MDTKAEIRAWKAAGRPGPHRPVIDRQWRGARCYVFATDKHGRGRAGSVTMTCQGWRIADLDGFWLEVTGDYLDAEALLFNHEAREALLAAQHEAEAAAHLEDTP
jgi:hypothetical protein